MKRLGLLGLLALALPALAATTPAPSPARTALVRDIDDMLEFIPAKAGDDVNVKYRTTFTALRGEAQTAPTVSKLRKRFEDEREAYFGALFKQQHQAYGDNPSAGWRSYREYVGKRYHLAVILRRLAENKNISLNPTQLQKVAAWRQQINEPTVSLEHLNALTTEIGDTYRVRADAQGSSWTPRSLILRASYLPRQQAPERNLAEPPSAVIAASATSPEGNALTRLIGGISRRASSYCQSVASAIVNSSAARHISAAFSSAVVWAESEFHDHVGSWAGCYGLGQLSEGAAAAYGVHDRGDITQNMRGTTGYLRDLLNQMTRKFGSPGDESYTNGLIAQEAVKVRNGADAAATYKQLFPRIPNSVKDAVAGYNAGGGAVQSYGGWDKLPLPRAPRSLTRAPSSFTQLALAGKTDRDGNALVSHCYNRPDRDNSYCQTMDYVPKVFWFQFWVQVKTAPGSVPTTLASVTLPPKSI